jgi:hypothetical protein
LCVARLLVDHVRFDRWRSSLGRPHGDGSTVAARALAADVERAARHLPGTTQCLPRSMALSWMLRRERISHAVIFAVRPAQDRGSIGDLHAWVEVDGEPVIGDLPGPWIETLRLGS